MSNLNELIKKSTQSRRLGTPTLIVQKSRKGGCPSCNRKKLVQSKISKIINKLKR